MRGFIGCDADLTPGTEIISGKNLELRILVIGQVTEDDAREGADRTGMPLTGVVAGERFYEVEITTMPVGSNN